METSVWVTRYEYQTREDIARIMARCRDAGFRSVMFQVRANGTTYFGSRREPWSEQFGFRAPAFDPLSEATRIAHANGLKIQAWVNVLPGWRADGPPSDPRQLYHTKPEWFLRTPTGEFATEGNYLFLNPTVPEVRAYLADLIGDIADDYPVDGIHLDYVRFPSGAASEQSPGDTASLTRFTRETGRPLGDLAAFRAWKAGSITDLVARVRRRLSQLPRRVVLTAAVNPDLERIKRDVLQDWPRWARERLVDAVFPMNYTQDPVLFAQRSRACVAVAGGTPVVMGIGVYKHQEARLSTRSTLRQMDAALNSGAAGVCLFSYGYALNGEWGPAVASWNRGHGARPGR